MKIIEQGTSRNKASKALILLHGRGGTAEDIISLSSKIADETFYVVAPEAPKNTWYPYSFMQEDKLNEPNLSDSIKIVQDLITQISQILPSDKIFIAGFSQGACLSLETCARNAIRYGGIIAFSGGLIGHTLISDRYQGNFANTPIFLGTSDPDSHVPLERVRASKILLDSMGAAVTLQVYPGFPHTIHSDEIIYARNMLSAGI